jgi:lipid-A-disaccharide synthase
VLIDFPEFNLRLAKALKKRGVKIVYYISPQIWAWRRRRVRTIAKVVDAMLVVLPFEVDFYRQHAVEAIHVGHPLVDEVPSLLQSWDQSGTPDDPKRIALLPGSRSSEIKSNLPVMLQAAEELARHMPIEVAVIKANSIPLSTIKSYLEGCPLSVRIVSEARFEELAGSHLALCASGTAALEVGLLTTPMIVIYRVHSWTFMLGRLLVRLPHISLVNLVLTRAAVPELLQSQAVPKRISDEAAAILADRDRIDRMRSDLAELRPRLGESGASARAASQVLKTLIGDKQSGSNLKIEEPAPNA